MKANHSPFGACPFWTVAGLFFFTVFSAAAGGAESGFHVAACGEDSSPGSREKPFATLERARDAVRELKKNGTMSAGGVTVWIGGGKYNRAKTFELTAEDSGSEQSPVTYRARENETVILTAGTVIRPACFRPVGEQAVVSRLDSAARGNVFQLDLAGQGIKCTGPYSDSFSNGGGIIELFFNGQRMQGARWPNEGYATMAKVVDKGESGGPGKRGGTFVYRDDRPARWNAADGVWLDGFWRVPWVTEAVRVKSIDTEKKQITLSAPVGGGLGSKYAGAEGSGKEPWYALNLVEEIDRPGEWALDFKSKTLYFWPPGPLDSADIVISDHTGAMVKAKEASFVTLRGLTFECGRGNGVEIDGGTGFRVAGCTLRNLGRTGVIIRGGMHNGVAGCDLYELGEGGVYLRGGDRKTLTPCGNFVDNCHIHHYGILKKTYAPAVQVGTYGDGNAVGCRVSHNLIQDAPHAGVLYGGNDNVFEFNEVCRVALDSGDVGAFYTWYDWTSRGNILRYNFVYDSLAVNAFYMDDGDSGDTIYGNICCRTACGPFIGGGHDNIVRNNIVIEAERGGIHIDSRGTSRGYNADNRNLVGRLQAMSYKQPPWSERYPELVKILDFHPELPTGNIIENNVTVQCRKQLRISGRKEALQHSTIRDNLDIPAAEAGFVDADRLNFNLKSDSTVFKKLPGFKPIPFDQIGLRIDEYRSRLPEKSANRCTADTRKRFDSNTDVEKSNRVQH